MTRIARLWLYASMAVGVVAAVVFLGFPGLDVATTHLFYVPDVGFPLYHVKAIRVFSDVLRWIAIVLAVGFLLALLLSLVPAGRRLKPSRRTVGYLFLMLALGPGLVVNVVFKDHWGRARPSHTVEFGGDRSFSPALAISDQCGHNCSFVSGDAAMGFYIVALGFAFRRRWLRHGGLLAGALIGGERIAQGGHYLSDVVFSGVFMVMVATLLYLAMMRGERGPGAPPRP